MTPPPPLPSWFGPRASTDDPAVAALLDQVAPDRTWQDIGGDFNLNIRLDGAATLVLRVHRPWATRGRVAGLRRLRERLQRAGIRVARPVPILGRELAESVAAGRNSKNLSRMCSQAQARSRTCGCSRNAAAFTRGCAQPGSRTCPSRSTTTGPSRQLHYWLGFTRRRLGAGAEPVVRRAKLLLEELGRARRGVELPLAPIHGDYKLGNAVQLSDGSWANLDLDFVRVRERLYDVAASLYWASESGANVELRELCDAYDSSAPEPVTPDERRLLPARSPDSPALGRNGLGSQGERARGGESDRRGGRVVGTPRGIDVVVRPGRGALRSR